MFSFENMRNQKFKEFREQLKSSSRFFLGSNKVMQVALGRSAADEISPGIHKVSKVAFLLLSLQFQSIIYILFLYTNYILIVLLAIARRCWHGFYEFV